MKVRIFSLEDVEKNSEFRNQKDKSINQRSCPSLPSDSCSARGKPYATQMEACLSAASFRRVWRHAVKGVLPFSYITDSGAFSRYSFRDDPMICVHPATKFSFAKSGLLIGKLSRPS